MRKKFIDNENTSTYKRVHIKKREEKRRQENKSDMNVVYILGLSAGY